jgi:hypothetical protein
MVTATVWFAQQSAEAGPDLGASAAVFGRTSPRQIDVALRDRHR